jgi:hypothetical protein
MYIWEKIEKAGLKKKEQIRYNLKLVGQERNG